VRRRDHYGWFVSTPEQFRSESGVNVQPALQDPGQVEHTSCPLTLGQNVPNAGSVNPPDLGQYQLSVVAYSVGCVVQMVAASFHALHAPESPELYGYDPPSTVIAVVL
jgi:hypothetical protein